jgi:hypothetical protein
VTEREQDSLLRKALQRVEPPDGFAERVLAKLPDRSLEKQRAPRTRSLTSWWSFPRFAWAPAMVAVLVAFAGAGIWKYQESRERRIRAERAREELVQALEITSVKVREAKSRLFRPVRGGIL